MKGQGDGKFTGPPVDDLMVVAQTGSLTAAAQQLFITQPAVSQQLASLEADLDVPLLVHHGAGQANAGGHGTSGLR